MILRLATMDDFVEVMEMSLEFLKESSFKNSLLDESKVSDVIIDFLANPEKTVVLAVDPRNETIGMIAGCVLEQMFNRERTAFEVIWWVKPGNRGAKTSMELFSAFEFWAKKMKCRYVQFGAAQGTEYSTKVARLYARKGYTPTEAHFLKELN